ncbi:F-box only protein 44-like [Anabas testudineus]|uniref:F-box only protein 44-like n=1 Tax=Anabas testudineus TaxID=64144 RepID=UPI000E45AE47|nr:F-box only protein 44-like [Anabas testudineus]
MGGTSSSSSKKVEKETETAASETETAASRWFSVPLEILEELFLNLPPEEVVCTCRLVCRQWKEVADSEYLWRERCRRERYHLRDVSRTPKDWRLFYFLCKKRRNLLKNPRAEDQFQDWQILERGGNGWKVEDVRVPHPDERVQKSFVTSYFFCTKSQLIDLEREGYNPAFMDHFQPDIKISDWYAQRWDCACQYKICVELLIQNKKPVHTFAPKTIFLKPWSDEKWYQMSHVFQNYGPGVRYIRFTHGGEDTMYRIGWHGVRLTDSCVEICPSVETY